MTDLYTDALTPLVLKMYNELPKILTRIPKLSVLANQFTTLDDAIQTAAVGIVKAANKFDANRGVKFTSYAIWLIRSELQGALGRSNQLGSVSNGSRFTVIGLTSDAYANAYAREGMPMTFAAHWDREGDEETIGSELGIEDEGPDAVDVRDAARWLMSLGVHRRSIAIVMARMGGESLKSIGQRHGVSKERIRQVANDTMRMLRERAGVEE